ncbi:hypothetical protein [Rhizobium anhuiense]|uniref:hypothetical protein n=1 Tax=Rhizobium anhuiense TaxID=1184720 RepID=UPI0015CF533A|nr:hypothetical protein [Rhizobium anhuiense]
MFAELAMTAFRVSIGMGGAAKATHGVSFAPVPIGLERSLDLNEKRDLDRELQAEFSLAEKVTDHLAESSKTAAGGAEEFGELAHDNCSFR